jgi:hypothetical protein
VLQAAEQCAPQDGGWGGCKGLGDGAAGVQWVILSPCRAGDAAVAETGCHRRGLVRRGGGSLDLKCYCFNALTDECIRAMSSLTALTSLELWRCSKVADEGMRVVRGLTGLTPNRYNTLKPVGAEKLAASSPIAAGWVGHGT